MKRSFTYLMAAFLMMLALVAQPFGMRGQTRTEEVVYTLDGTITGGSSGYATESEITQNNLIEPVVLISRPISWAMKPSFFP